MARRKAPAEYETRRSPGPIRREAPGRSPAEAPIVESKYVDIYPADIERVEQNYINSLPDPESIYNINAFIGLIFQLHREVIKPALIKPGNIKSGCAGYDIRALDSIFYNIFIPLIAKYHITPTIGMFLYLTGLYTSVIDSWKKPNTNNIYNDSNDIDNIDIHSKYDVNSNISKYSYYQKWSNYVEQWILGNVVNTNSIGGMFALKAVYGYSDTQTVRIEAPAAAPRISENQLKSIAEAAAPLPEIE